jgi:hypothetical protein
MSRYIFQASGLANEHERAAEVKIRRRMYSCCQLSSFFSGKVQFLATIATTNSGTG